MKHRSIAKERRRQGEKIKLIARINKLSERPVISISSALMFTSIGIKQMRWLESERDKDNIAPGRTELPDK